MQVWERNQYVATTMVFVVYTGFAFLIPFLPLYVRQLGVRDEESAALWGGVLIGITPLLAGLLAPVWGRLADRYGHKPMVIRALGSYVVLLVLSAFVRNVWQLFALRVASGLFAGIGPLSLAMATALTPREHTGRAVGLVQGAQILSAAVGPFAGGLLADLIGIPGTFVATAGLCALGLLLTSFFYVEVRPQTGGAAAEKASLADVLRIPKVMPLLTVLFLVNFIGRSFTPILPLHLQGLGVRVARLGVSTGMLISVYSLTAAVSAAALGRASRRYPPRALLVASLSAGAATVLPMALVGSFDGMLLLGALLGLASGGALTLCYTIGGLLVPQDRKATAFGFFSGAALFGGAVSPTVAGLLAHWELKGIFYVDAALFALLAAALLPGAVTARSPAVAEGPRLR